MIDENKLRELAQNATKGEWKIEQENVHIGQICTVNQGGQPWFEIWSEYWEQDPNNSNDAEYICAVQPQTILALLDELARLRDVLADKDDLLRHIGDYAHDRSTGPAVPDDLWEVRRMAYEGYAS